eukprot:scaffold227821_cov25-Tisochrysis_lutea.AAC.1
MPTGLRITKAHVTHPELKATFCLDIIGIKKNPNGQVGTVHPATQEKEKTTPAQRPHMHIGKMYTQLGVVTKGTVIEVNVSELGLVTPGGK